MSKKGAIGVIGQGFVGGSLSTVFLEREFDVYAHDIAGAYVEGVWNNRHKNGIRLRWLWSLEKMVKYAENPTPVEHFGKGARCNVYFVCVPTPMRKEGSADLTIVESILEELASFDGDRIAVVKSTVPPGSTEKWNKRFNKDGLTVVFNPEFLTEANALDDVRNQDRIIVGGPRPASTKVKALFRQAFPKVKIIKTGSSTAEMVKYFTNAFLSVKVSFANEMYQICEAIGIDYDKVVEYGLHDTRIGNTHLSAPGPDGSFGFGGHCFPKDLNALIFVALELGVDPAVLKGVWLKNLEVRDPEDRDWEKMVGRAVSEE